MVTLCGSFAHTSQKKQRHRAYRQYKRLAGVECRIGCGCSAHSDQAMSAEPVGDNGGGLPAAVMKDGGGDVCGSGVVKAGRVGEGAVGEVIEVCPLVEDKRSKNT